MIVRTVRHLKEAIKDLPDDTPIISYQSDMEKSGYQGISGVKPMLMVKKRKKPMMLSIIPHILIRYFLRPKMVLEHFAWSLINILYKKAHPCCLFGCALFFMQFIL